MYLNKLHSSLERNDKHRSSCEYQTTKTELAKKGKQLWKSKILISCSIFPKQRTRRLPQAKTSTKTVSDAAPDHVQYC